ncbi:MAG: peptide-methionine (S)-S-oxide reductase MsrA [Candidatus Izimaplasma sp.]|nr:peptide-methionine (S)-S-oxide reductase MsrA [Candidatus Izimaplasma bacterium]
MKKIILAGGCFWGVQAYFDLVKGVEKTIVGYIDGSTKEPSYMDVLNGSGHAESVRVEFDEKIIDLKKLLDHFFNIIDPTLINRQGNDLGKSYRTGIYCFNKVDLEFVKSYIDSIRENYHKKIQTETKLAEDFYPAEIYHQNYLDKNPGGYCHINLNKVKNIEE